jgi:hypothetical protein
MNDIEIKYGPEWWTPNAEEVQKAFERWPKGTGYVYATSFYVILRLLLSAGF